MNEDKVKRSPTLILFLCWIAGGSSAAQTYPARPIRLVIGPAASDSSDVMALTIALTLSERLGQQVVVDNKSGGGGNIAANLVAKSTSDDGHTLFFMSTGQLSHGGRKDFAACPVGQREHLDFVGAVLLNACFQSNSSKKLSRSRLTDESTKC
jgi:tripartite-type tricarboxylate transporter receptor subunit TctC